MIRCAQDVHAECENAGDLGELAGSSQSCSPMYKEQDQTVVYFCVVLQGNMAVGLKSSEGKSLKKSPPRIDNCEAIRSPKEHLAQIIWTIGKKRYLNTAHNKKIAEKVSIDNLRRCPSFLTLDAYVRSSIFKLPAA